MAEFKLVIGTKDGKSIQKVITDSEANAFLEKKINDVIKGEVLNLTGWEFKITGGSDKAGFPMRADVPGIGRRKILAIRGVGVTNKKKYRGKDKKGKRTMKGMRTRKTVAGNTVYGEIVQINLKAIKEGSAPLPASAPKKEKAKK